ncbi:MAG: ABC transporter ATP-binding protein [Prevotella sp.]|nr:ABC transporter ATP-binding protein [Prevotella sp.]
MQIELKGLVKSFKDKTAVDIDSLHIADGEMVGLVGNNGAGKTTLFRLMLDLLKADNGYVELTFATDDANPNDTLTVNPAMLEDWKQYTGAYIDSGFLIEFLTPEEYFDFIAKVSNISKEQLDTRLDKYAQFMGGEIMGQKKLIRDFSAGNKQKIGIVAALINQPQLLILDEPFNFLDPSSQNILKQLLTNYNSRHGATILLSSHNLQHTVEVSSRIVLLEHGKIIKDLPNTEGSADAELEDYFGV